MMTLIVPEILSAVLTIANGTLQQVKATGLERLTAVQVVLYEYRIRAAEYHCNNNDRIYKENVLILLIDCRL